MTYFGEVPPQRQRLASALRSLRQAADLTTTELAERLGMSQSKVSRLELGRTTPTAADVQAWARVCGTPDAQLGSLMELIESVATEAVAWRRAIRRGLPQLQRDVQDLEASAGTIRSYQPVLIPGLLQTPEYARRIFAARDENGRADAAEAVGVRMERQKALYDESKHLEFVIGEAALRWRFGPRAAVVEQLNRIALAATLPTVTLGVIPLAAELTVWHSHGFNLFDERGGEPALVHIELLTTGLTVSQADDVEEYRTAFARLLTAALRGEDVAAFVRALVSDVPADIDHP